MELTIGNTLVLQGVTYQNYDLNATNFLPFGFTGVVINRNGDNTEASLLFPNNSLTRSWASEAVDDQWLAVVTLRNVGTNTTIYTYNGQVGNSSWTETMVTLQLTTILDAVGADVPFRVIGEGIVGAIPNSSAFRLS